MTTNDHWFKSDLREMAREECFELLSAEVLGRIGFNDDLGPVVLPVNYRIHGESVVIATGWSTSIARCAIGRTIALEVEQLDPLSESGWSVLVRGKAELLSHDAQPEPNARPRPWADGQRPLLIRIVPEVVTGRRLIDA
jgi:nitroimidazol reductase NimA-like FMN-containing flavoprotein (pyridoxamine 5'-phosphate oxidase superfamily)